MEKLDELISCEENRIEHLMEIREYPSKFREYYRNDSGTHKEINVEHDIEKAYEQLAIYKIRKLMGF
ncbi:MAG: hypothetical protein ACLFQA_11375 [Bacteroidales bacterium]